MFRLVDRTHYGFLNIATAFLDRLIKKNWFKKITLGSIHPDCSILIGEDFKHTLHYTFGQQTGTLMPQPMYDRCHTDDDIWECLHPLAPLYHEEIEL
jgi:hypothetical protein